MRPLPSLGLGCAALGLNTVPDAAAQATFEAALAGGIGYFDTSPLYGAGLSEKRLGRALAGRKANPFVSTKVGYRIDFEEGGRQKPESRVLDFSAAHVRQSVEASLGRLGLDHIDLVYLHDASDPAGCDDAVAVLREMQAEGLVGGVGIGVTDCDAAVAMLGRHRLDAVLIAGRYTLLDRSAEAALFPMAAAQGVAIVAGGVFNSGILADPSAGWFDYAPASDAIRERAGRQARLAAEAGMTLKAAALHFVADDTRIGTTLLGAASTAEVVECLDLLRQPMAPEIIAAIAAA